MIASYRHKSLRNPNINYRAGWWAVTVQVAKNKSLLGAVVGKRVVLNALGRAVEASRCRIRCRLRRMSRSA